MSERARLSIANNPVFFFFQAEDGIRYSSVTGVQTCALPISRLRITGPPRSGERGSKRVVTGDRHGNLSEAPGPVAAHPWGPVPPRRPPPPPPPRRHRPRPSPPRILRPARPQCPRPNRLPPPSTTGPHSP